MHRLASSLTLLAALAIVLGGCASSEVRNVDPQASACLQRSESARPPEFDQSRLSALTARADAFASCMEASGYVYDEDGADKQLAKFEQKRMFDPWKADPYQQVQLQRQQLRLTPSLWRRSAS
jgi:hypothetical protein